MPVSLASRRLQRRAPGFSVSDSRISVPCLTTDFSRDVGPRIDGHAGLSGARIRGLSRGVVFASAHRRGAGRAAVACVDNSRCDARRPQAGRDGSPGGLYVRRPAGAWTGRGCSPHVRPGLLGRHGRSVSAAHPGGRWAECPGALALGQRGGARSRPPDGFCTDVRRVGAAH